MEKEKFEQYIVEGINSIPEKFRKLMDNVAIVLETEPSKAQLELLKLRPGFSLFGLYEGIPRTKRGTNYSFVMPDKISIFQKPIEEAAQTDDKIRELIKDTVWHEIAHHFGMDEQRVRAAEHNRNS